MTRWTLAGCMALAAVGAAAVLDVGPTAAEAAPSVSPFAGSWSGTWTVFEGEAVAGTGTFDWTISDTGRISGTVYNTTSGQGGTMVGHVGADGNLRIVGYVPADARDFDFGSGFPFDGTAAIDGDGRLIVSATRTDSDRTLVAVLETN